MHVGSLNIFIDQSLDPWNFKGTNPVVIALASPSRVWCTLFWVDKSLAFVTLILKLKSISYDCNFAPPSMTRYGRVTVPLIFRTSLLLPALLSHSLDHVIWQTMTYHRGSGVHCPLDPPLGDSSCTNIDTLDMVEGILQMCFGGTRSWTQDLAI